MGEEVGAAVVLKEGQDVSADDLKAYVKEQVANYKYPRKIWFVDELPRARRQDRPSATSRCPRRPRRPDGGGRRHPRHPPLRRRRRDDPPLVPRRGGGEARRPPRDAAVEGRAPRRGLRGELAKIAIGQSDVAPSKKDRRFKDDAWRGNPAVPAARAGLPGAGKTVDDLIATRGLDERAERRVRFVAENVIDALAPTNFPAQPGGGQGHGRRGRREPPSGAPRRLAARRRSPARIPATSTRERSRSARTSPLTPGAVVLRDEMFELLQFAPTTEEVREYAAGDRPADDQQVLRRRPRARAQPGRVPRRRAASRCFSISWRNPTAENADWDLDAYVERDHRGDRDGAPITRRRRRCTWSACAPAASRRLRRSATGRRRASSTGSPASRSTSPCSTTTARARSAASSRPTPRAAAVAASSARATSTATTLARTFAWLRPNDMIWNYWVNNYLLGNKPAGVRPPVLERATRWTCPRACTATSSRSASTTPSSTAGCARDPRQPDRRRRDHRDTYIVAGETDHITPWPNCYRTTQLLGGDPRFVLSTGGHIAAVINPPGNPKAHYHGPTRARRGRRRGCAAELTQGAPGGRTGTRGWRSAAARWPGPASGSAAGGHKVLGAAPGTYVLD